MIPERHQVSAVPIEGGERVTGYYIFYDMNPPMSAIFLPENDRESAFVEIDPVTIEPVRIKPVCQSKSVFNNDKAGVCPVCKNSVNSVTNYCSDCGMALSWEV